MSMVECLARVLCRAELLRQLGVPIGQGGPLETRDLRRQAQTVLDVAVEELWPQHVPAVLSLLAVLRRPTDGMIEAGSAPNLILVERWQAMILAATEYPQGEDKP
jgi:hypothetical protein